MTTIRFAGTDRKTFTPIPAALNALPNGAGTLVVLFKKTVTGSFDGCGLNASGLADVYHTCAQGGGPLKVTDDDGLVGPQSTATAPDDTTNWWLQAVDWAGGGAGLERMHWRNQTSLGSWTHSPSTANNGGMRAGPATGWFECGYCGTNSTATKDIAVVAAWAGTRFSDSDYGLWSSTNDLYNHALGHPTFLCELNTSTPFDLMGLSTYSSGNSSGTTFVGADPPNWTFGIGFSGQSSASGPARAGMFTPQLQPAGWF